MVSQPPLHPICCLKPDPHQKRHHLVNRSLTPSQNEHPGAAPALARGGAAARQTKRRLISRGLACAAIWLTTTSCAQTLCAQTSQYNRYMTPPGGTTNAQPTAPVTQPPPYTRPQSVVGTNNYPPNQYAPAQTNQPPAYTPPAPANAAYGQSAIPPAGYQAQPYNQAQPFNAGNGGFTTTQSGGVQFNGPREVQPQYAAQQPQYAPSPPPPTGYGAPGTYVPATVPEYQVAPGVTGSVDPRGGTYAALAPGSVPPGGIPGEPTLDFSTPTPYQPTVRDAPIVVYAQEARTGRIILGGSVNSDLGLAGQVIVDERNFDWKRFPTSWGDLFGGRAFRGDGPELPGGIDARY